MTGALLIRWGESKVGREGKALAYFDGLAKQGKIHAHHEYISLTGASGGFMVIDGQMDDLLTVQVADATRKIVVEASSNVEDFTQEIFVGGSEATLQHEIALYGETLAGLGYL